MEERKKERKKEIVGGNCEKEDMREEWRKKEGRKKYGEKIGR